MANIMTKRGSLDNIVTYEHYCDTKADLANIPENEITLGSTAIVLQDEDGALGVYIATSDKEWIAMMTTGGSGGGDVVKGLIERTISETISIPEGTTQIGGAAFSFCNNMAGEIILPESVNLIENAAFSNCAKITKIQALDANIKTSMNSTYAGCSKVTEVPPVTSPYSLSSNLAKSTFAGCAELKRAIITNPKSLDNTVFAGCSSLEYVYIGATCETIAAGCFGGVPVTCKIDCGFAEGAIEGFPANGGFAGNPSDVQITYNVPVPEVED